MDSQVRSYPGVRPRNVVATREEIDALLAAAAPHMRLWLLLCSDLAIRSGTAVTLAPLNYDQRRRDLRFVTKANAHMTLPVTAQVAELLDQCDQTSPLPFVRQLWPRDPQHPGPRLKRGCDGIDALRWQFKKLCAQVGITRRIVPHDMRRATAVAMLQHTHDLRAVQALLGHRNLQSTFWYLDHDLRQVSRSTLEIIKRPTWAEKEEETA
jgi:integrase